MFLKALYFSSASSCTSILNTPDPKQQKKRGQRVAEFDAYRWGLVKLRAARVVNWYKFTDKRNVGMKGVLLGTRERKLAEASTGDRVWGIGYSADEADGYRELWGKNLLGTALMDVRRRVGECKEKVGRGEGVIWEWDGAVDREGEGEGEGKVANEICM